MATTNKRLAATALTSSLTTYYTAPGATKMVLGALTVCNTGGAARLVTVKMAGRFLLSARSLDPSETLALSVPHCLETGETIQANQDTGTDVELIASGVEIT